MTTVPNIEVIDCMHNIQKREYRSVDERIEISIEVVKGIKVGGQVS